MSVTSGRYRITTHLGRNPAIGIDPRPRSERKQVIVVPAECPPPGTNWEVRQEDGQFYLLAVDGANVRPQEDKVCAFYGQPGVRWKIVHHPLRRGYTILSPEDESLAWHLPNPEYDTQVELKRLGLILGEGYYFNLEKLVKD